MAALPDDGNITADGDYDIQVTGDTKYNVNIEGNFGGGTVEVQEKNEFSGNYSPVSTTSSITSDFSDVLEARNGANIRFNVSGSAAPDFYIHIVALRNG